MENYLHPEINEKRLLHLPEGLKDLMSDITREVLRAQPVQLYQFISEYLSAMLITREHLFVASQINEDICCCLSEHEICENLAQLGIDEENCKKAAYIINNYFSTQEKVQECSVIQKILETVPVDSTALSDLQEVIRKSFLKHRAQKINLDQTLFKCSSNEEICNAVEHTLRIYKKAQPSEAEFNRMAVKIQAAYRAYKVTRYLCKEKMIPTPEDDLVVYHQDISLASSDDYIENEEDKEIEEKYPNPKETVTIKFPPHICYDVEEESSEIEIIEPETKESEENIRKSYDSDEVETRQRRFVSFNAEEKELDNFEYQEKSSLSIKQQNEEQEHEEIEIEEAVVAEHDLSLAEDCESIYDIDYDDISGTEVCGD